MIRIIKIGIQNGAEETALISVVTEGKIVEGAVENVDYHLINHLKEVIS